MTEVFHPDKFCVITAEIVAPMTSIQEDDKPFCCEGCKLMNELLTENNLRTYYQLTEHPGNKPAKISKSNRFSWLALRRRK